MEIKYLIFKTMRIDWLFFYKLPEQSSNKLHEQSCNNLLLLLF